MTTDAQALAIAQRSLPQEPRAGLHLAIAVGRTETHYGDNWGPLGADSNNWGAEHATEMSQAAFPHLDHHADGTPYMAAFVKFPTPEAGFKHLAYTVLKPNVLALAEGGDGTGAVYAMHRNGYFEYDPAKYSAAVEKQYAGFLRATGEPRLLNFGPAPEPGATENDAPSSGQGEGLGLLEVALGFGLAWGVAKIAEVVGPTKRGPG